MSEPIDIESRRDKYDGILCPECGGANFTAQSLMLRTDYTVQGYVAPLSCFGCGHLMIGGR